ncbi:MAG: hypothetical protein CO108_30305, partial [Deltaproteobacteria bacterium CG_4_9_14_3_um_filter_63_12]
MAFLVGSSTDLAIARLVRYAWADLSRRLPPRGFRHRALVLAQGCDEAVGSRWIEATRREGPLRRAGFCDTLSYGLGVTALFVCKK